MNNEKAGANFATPRSKTGFYDDYRLCDNTKINHEVLHQFYEQLTSEKIESWRNIVTLMAITQINDATKKLCQI